MEIKDLDTWEYRELSDQELQAVSGGLDSEYLGIDDLGAFAYIEYLLPKYGILVAGGLGIHEEGDPAATNSNTIPIIRPLHPHGDEI